MIDTAFVTDDELIERLGVPRKDAEAALKVLDGNRASGFPQKQQLWGGRRYWPAVKAYFDVHYGLKQGGRNGEAQDYQRPRIGIEAAKVGLGGRVAG